MAGTILFNSAPGAGQFRLPFAIRTILFTLFVPGVTAVGVPWAVFSLGWEAPLPAPVLRPPGAALIGLGVLTYLLCALELVRVGRGTPAPFDPPSHLVVSGPYAILRNPIYASVVLVMAGEALFLQSGTLLLYAAALVVGLHLRIVLIEEPALRRRFGEPYDRYCATVPRWWDGAGKRS